MGRANPVDGGAVFGIIPVHFGPRLDIMLAVGQTNLRKTLAKSYSLAYASLLVFVLIYFARPEDWIPGLAYLRPALIAGGLAIVGFVFAALGSGAGVLALPRVMWYLVALFFQLFAAAVFSPVWRGGAFQFVVYSFSKVVLIVIVITLVVTTLGRLRKLIFIQAFCFGLVAIVSILEAKELGGRLTGSLSGIYGNPNDLAFAIALGFPLCWTFLHRSRNVIKKLAWTTCMTAMGYAVFLTASRGGLIVLLISVLICLWEFGFKGGRRYILVIAAFVAIGVVAIAPKNLMDKRFRAIENPSASGSAYGSFQQRQALLATSLHVTFEHPLFGVGPGNFQIVSGSWHVAHNAFTGLSAEGGIAALILFLLMAQCSFSNLAKVGSDQGVQGELQLWRRGLKVAMVTLLMGFLFSSSQYQLFPYMLMSYTAAFRRIASQREATEAQPDAVNGAVGIGAYTLKIPENAGSAAAIRAD